MTIFSDTVRNLKIQNCRIKSKKILFGSRVLGVILCIIAAVCIYYSVVPTPPISCYDNSEEMKVNKACNPLNQSNNKDEECKNAKDALDKKTKLCSEKTPKRVLLIGILLIPFALVMILFVGRCDNQIQTEDVTDFSSAFGMSPGSGGGLLKKYAIE